MPTAPRRTLSASAAIDRSRAPEQRLRPHRREIRLHPVLGAVVVDRGRPDEP